MSISDKNRNTILGQRINIRIIDCCDPARCCCIENNILCVSFFSYIILQTKETILSIKFISVKIHHFFSEFWIEAALFDKDGEITEPFYIFLWILLSLIFNQLDYTFCKEVSKFSHQCTILECFSWDIEWNILAIDNTLHKTKEIRK